MTTATAGAGITATINSPPTLRGTTGLRATSLPLFTLHLPFRSVLYLEVVTATGAAGKLSVPSLVPAGGLVLGLHNSNGRVGKPQGHP